jgi:hypothetical protein
MPPASFKSLIAISMPAMLSLPYWAAGPLKGPVKPMTTCFAMAPEPKKQTASIAKTMIHEKLIHLLIMFPSFRFIKNKADGKSLSDFRLFY